MSWRVNEIFYSTLLVILIVANYVRFKGGSARSISESPLLHAPTDISPLTPWASPPLASLKCPAKPFPRAYPSSSSPSYASFKLLPSPLWPTLHCTPGQSIFASSQSREMVPPCKIFISRSTFCHLNSFFLNFQFRFSPLL